MRRTKTFFIFFSLLLLGYCCQVSRFQSAAFRPAGEKALSKTIVACQHSRTPNKNYILEERSASSAFILPFACNFEFYSPLQKYYSRAPSFEQSGSKSSARQDRGPPHFS
jgi:hypothetical protein